MSHLLKSDLLDQGSRASISNASRKPLGENRQDDMIVRGPMRNPVRILKDPTSSHRVRTRDTAFGRRDPPSKNREERALPGSRRAAHTVGLSTIKVGTDTAKQPSASVKRVPDTAKP